VSLESAKNAEALSAGEAFKKQKTHAAYEALRIAMRP
jgi:hypothetical protein